MVRSSPENRPFLRAERIIHDARIKVVNGQRRYEIFPDGTKNRFQVQATVQTVELAQYVVNHGDLVRVAGPFRVKAAYDLDADIVPSEVWLLCETCEWKGKRRSWAFRRYLLKDSMDHRCPNRFIDHESTKSVAE